MLRSLRLWRVVVILAVILVPFLVRTSPAQAATNVSGTISSNTTWTLTNSPYVVTGDVTVASGVTLTLEPGVIVKFAAGKSLIVNGTLDAQAGPSSLIYFTSDKDDVGGDTNGDGTATSPARGDWAHIRVAGSAVLDYVEVRYGGKGLYSGLVYLTGSLTLRNATLTESYSTGLYRYSGSGGVTVEQSAIRNNASSGIYLSGSGTPSITSSTIQGNSAYGVYVSATNHAYINGNSFSGNGSTAVYVMAGNPAWNGQVTGNTFQTSASNPVTVNFTSGGLAATSDLSGNTFTGNVRNGIDLQGTMLLDSSLRPATYIVQSTLTVGSSAVRPTLTIQPETVVKFNVQQRMDVYGTLNAVGTTTSRIHFTSLRDDTVGGDTNNDGSTSSPYNGYWSTIRSYPGGTISLQYATVRYGGYTYGSLRVEGGALELRDSELTNSTTAGISHASGTAPVVISGNTIADNSNYALNLAAAASPSITGNTFRNHTADGALYVAAAATPSVTGNTFENNKYGLHINAGSPAWSGTVANNTFTGHTTSPIYIYLNAGGLAGTTNLSGNTFTNNAYNGVTLNGTVSVSTALPAGPTYVVSSTQSLTVASGATLTLNSGSVLKLGAGRYISVTGTLQGRGTQESQAYITALTDDTAGGDTNNDGSATTPVRGYWGYIYTTGASTIDLQHTTVRYGGLNMVGTGMVRGYGAGGTITLASSTLEESSEYGLGIENATTLTISGSTVRSNSGGGAILKAASPASITGSTFSGNGGAGLRANAGSDPAVTGNTFSANTGAGVWVLTGSSAWAGTVTGNHFQANGSAMDLYFEGGGFAAGADISGNTWSDNTYNGIYTYGTIGLNTRLQGGNVYVLNSTFEISSAAALTLDPGAIVKIGPQNPGFRVYGTLSAVGTAENPVVFTAIPDDSAGGDTNNDGAATVPVPDYWDRIAIYVGGAATIEQAEVRYGGWSAGWGAITVEGGGLTLRNSKVHNNSLGVVFQTRGAYVLEGNSFSGNTNYAVWVADTQNGAIDARYNYWGHDSGPRPYGTGDAYRQDYVLVNPWTGKDYWYARHAGFDPTSPPIQHVNAVLGSYTRTYTDLATHDGIGPRVSIIRTYNSFDGSPGPLGPGWSLNWEAGLAFFDGGATVVASYGDGKQTRFTQQTGGTYAADSGDYNELALAGGTYVLTTPDKSVYRYDAAGKLTSMSDPNGNTVTLSYDPGTANLTGIQDAAGRSFALGWTSGRLTSVTDALTRQVQYGYDASGRLQTVTTDRGTVTYTYDGASARIATITNELSQAEATLTYDSDFRVATQTDAESHMTTYTYEIVNRTVRTRAPGAAADTQVEYDTRLRRVLQIDPVGRRWQYSFDDNNNPTGETDPWQVQTARTFDQRGNLLTETVAVGLPEAATVQLTYGDPANPSLPTRITDGRGNYTDYVYNAAGNPVEIKRPRSIAGTITWDSTFYDYDTYGRLIAERAPQGRTTTYRYDALQPGWGPTEVENAGGFTTRYQYDAMGRRTRVDHPTDTDPAFAVTRYTAWTYNDSDQVTAVADPVATVGRQYDAAGRLQKAEDGRGYYAWYTYWPTGRLKTETVYTTLNVPVATTEYTYDGRGNLVQAKDAAGRITDYQYDDADRRTREQLPAPGAGAGPEIVITYSTTANQYTVTDPRDNATTYVLDARGRVKEIARPLGVTERFAYDQNSNRTQVTDGRGYRTQYQYDSQNRLEQVIWPDLEASPVTVEQYSYDANGNVATLTDGRGNQTIYTYNALNQLSREQGPAGLDVAYNYDVVGNRVTRAETVTVGMTPVTFTETTYYDARNRVRKVVDASGQATEYGYDAGDNRTSIKDGRDYTTRYTYDWGNRLDQVLAPVTEATLQQNTYDLVGNLVQQKDARNQITTFTYDALNRLTKVVTPEQAPLATSTQYEYDAAGNRTAEIDPRGNQTVYAYDALNRLTSVTATSADGLTTTTPATYAYDLAGNMTHFTDGRSQTTEYSYDPYSRLAWVKDAQNQAESYQYDRSSNRTQVQDRNGNVITYGYDSENRLDSVTATGLGSVSYTYYENGRRKTMADPTGTTSYDYHANGQLQQVSAGTRAMSYTYDPAGNLATVTDWAGTTVTYGYDEQNRLTAATVGGDLQATAYEYWETGLVRKMTLPTGVTAEYTYDNDQRLTGLVWKDGGGVTLFSYSQAYDAAGNITGRTDETGATQYTYDYLQRLQTVTEPAGRVITYGYDAAGNRTQEDVTESGSTATTTYTYNSLNRLTQQSGPGGTVSFTYDPNGNMTGWGSRTLAYDQLNRLTGVTESANTLASFTYNGDGLRVEKTAGGATTRYWYNPAQEVVLETDGAGAVQAHYIFGLDRLRVQDSGSGTAYYVTDGHGDTRALLDPANTAQATYRFDAFGQIAAETGSSPNPFLYTGEPYDRETGLIYLRARYYAPGLGRFVTQDSWQGDPLQPLSRNLYTYARNNPLRYIDPSGHAEIAGAGGGCGNDLKCKEAVAQGLTYSAGRASSSPRTQPVPLLLTPETPSLLHYGFSPQAVYYWGPDLLSGFVSTGFSSTEVENLNQKADFRLKTDPSHTFYDYSDSIFADRLLSLDLYFVPGVGLIKAAQEAATGIDLITGERLGSGQRALLGAAVVVPLAPRLLHGAKSLPALADQTGALGQGLKSSRRLYWGTWGDYPKVTLGDKTYARIGSRLYTRHAIERMLPRGLTTQGRSISPTFVEEAIRSGTTSLKSVKGVTRVEHRLGDLRVFTEQGGKIVVTVVGR